MTVTPPHKIHTLRKLQISLSHSSFVQQGTSWSGDSFLLELKEEGGMEEEEVKRNKKAP